jgi:hypothetical protein
MSSAFDLRSLVVCDDIRQEVTGKEILIGVYTDTIIVPQFPAALNGLFFRVSLSIIDPSPQIYTFALVDAQGNVKARAEQGLPENFRRSFGTIVVGVRNIKLEKPGDLTIKLGIDGEPIEIAKLHFRTPASDAETLRVSASLHA